MKIISKYVLQIAKNKLMTKSPKNSMRQHPVFADAFLVRLLSFAMSKILNVVRRYTLLYKALLGWRIPMPFLPYPGIIALFTALFAAPDVLAEKLFLNDGVLNPYFMTI